jgi:hypothetical protein
MTRGTCLAATVFVAGMTMPVVAADVSGTWKAECQRVESGPAKPDPGPTVIVTLTQTDERLEGECLVQDNGARWRLTGSRQGDRITWTCVNQSEGTATFSGTLNGSTEEISGTWKTDPYAAEGTFTATKQK